MFSRLLVPLDFTDKNEAAVTIALETARRDGAEVTLLHVIETIEHSHIPVEIFQLCSSAHDRAR